MNNIGHNSAPSASEKMERARRLAAKVDGWGKKVPTIDDDEEASVARDFLAAILAEEKAVTAAHKAEKQPFIDGGKKVDEKWRPVKDLLAACKPPLQLLLTKWARKLEAEKAETARKAAEEAERRAREASAAAAAATTVEEKVAAAAAEKAAVKAQKAAEVAANDRARVTSASGGARAASLRKTYAAELTSYPIACRTYANHPDVVSVLEKLASADVRAAKGAEAPAGFRVVERETFA